MALTEIPVELSSSPGIVDNSNATAITIAASENVGIGTSSPSAPLNVYNASNPYTKFEDAANYLNVGVITSNYGLINSSLPLSFQVNDTERMRILADGSVVQGNTVSLVASNYNNQAGAAWHKPDGHYEIATTSNVAPLQIGKNNANDGTLVTFRKQSSVVGSISSRGGVTLGLILNPTSGVGAGLSGTSNAIFPVDETTTPVNDQISLGTTSNAFKDLYLSGGVQNITASGVATGTLISAITGVTNGFQISANTSNEMTYDFNTGAGLKMRFTNDGNLLVGTTTPVTKLTVSGQGAFGSADASGNGIYLYVSGALSDNSYMSRNSAGSGTTTWYIGNQSITTSSDLRLKDNIVDSQRNAVEIINNLRVVDHTWNDPSDQSINNKNSRGVWTGLIAQEAVEHIPWLVNRPLEDVDENGNKNYWHMDYGYSAPLLIKAIQEQQATIEALTARIAALES